MPTSNDCLNTRPLGRNLTPVPIIDSARALLGGIIWTDYASDAEANLDIQAKRYFDFVSDGYRALMECEKSEAVWLNPPGQSYTGGTESERKVLLELLMAFTFATENEKGKTEKELREAKKATQLAEAEVKKYLRTVPAIKRITAADWFRALYRSWENGFTERCIYLVYRGGAFGSIPYAMACRSLLCKTCANAYSPVISRAGRISFEQTTADGQRIAESANTQSSDIGYLPFRFDEHTVKKFKREFEKYGAIYRPA